MVGADRDAPERFGRRNEADANPVLPGTGPGCAPAPRPTGTIPGRATLPAPLVLLLVFALVVARCVQEPSRAESRARISGLVQGRQMERARADLAAYLERFHDEEDHWFAARAYLRMGQPVAGIDAIWKHPVLPSRPGTARRFAEAGLYALGWRDEERLDPTPFEPRALIYLAEGGHPWAQDRLRRRAAQDELRETTVYFFPAFHLAAQVPLDILIDEFRRRGTEVFDIAAAVGSLHAEPYPEREHDIELLVKVVTSNEWRRLHVPVWCFACLALGRSGDPRALEALEQTEARLEGASSARDRMDLLLARVGLLAAGKWEVDESVAADVLGPKPTRILVLWYLEALIHRYLQGDLRTELRLRQVWEIPGSRILEIRRRLARAFLLRGTVPDETARTVWVPRMLRDLQAPGRPLMSVTMARATSCASAPPGRARASWTRCAWPAWPSSRAGRTPRS